MRKLTQQDIIEIVDYWLIKGYNTKLMDIPEEVRMSKDFYSTYPVSNAIHDEWVDWAKAYIKNKIKCSKKYLERGWAWLYLDLAPAIKDERIQS